MEAARTLHFLALMTSGWFERLDGNDGGVAGELDARLRDAPGYRDAVRAAGDCFSELHAALQTTEGSATLEGLLFDLEEALALVAREQTVTAFDLGVDVGRAGSLLRPRRRAARITTSHRRAARGLAIALRFLEPWAAPE